MPVRLSGFQQKSRCCYTRNRDNEHIQMWMKVRHLLNIEFNYDIDKQNKAQNHYDQQLLETNKQQLISAFGDINTILPCFIKNADSKQLINIYNVLKTIKLNSSQASSNKTTDDDDDDDDDDDIVILDDWICKQCNTVNDATLTMCPKCRVTKPNKTTLDLQQEKDLYTMDETIKMEQHWDIMCPKWKIDWPLHRCQNIVNTSNSYSSTLSYAKMYLKYWNSIQFLEILQTRNILFYRGFTQLSCVEIVNICGFLQRKDIIQFKSTSFKIAIICLQEMTKLNVCVYNMNKLINYENKDLFKLNDEKFMSFCRYFPNIRISTIYEEWERFYNIPTHRQLICEYNPFDYQYTIFTAKDMNNYNQLTDFSISNISKSVIVPVFDTTFHWRITPSAITSANATKMRGPYLLFDMQNITILTPNIISNMYKYNELIKQKHNNNKTKPDLIYPTANNNKYSLLTIKYFDIMDQRLDVVNFICISCDVTFIQLFDYIENHFNIKYTLNTTNQHSQTWYNKFKKQLSELNAYGACVSHCKYDGYIENENIEKRKVMDINERLSSSFLKVFNNNWHSDHQCLKQVFVFQFNANHPYFIQKIMEKENKTFNKTYKFCETFISDYKKFKIHFKLSSDQLAHNQHFLHSIYFKTHNNIANTQFIHNSSNVYSFECGSLWDFGLLRKKLASKLNCLPEFLEIYSFGSNSDSFQNVAFKINDNVIYKGENAKIVGIANGMATITYKSSITSGRYDYGLIGFGGYGYNHNRNECATVSFHELKQKSKQQNNNYNISDKPMQRRSWSETVSKCINYEWRLVEYNTKTFNCLNECIYKLKLILSDEGSDALQHYTKQIDFPLFIKFKRQFKINQLINFVNQQIQQYHHHNKELSSILLNMNVNNCILTSFSRCYASNELFTNQTPNVVTNLNIFSIQNENIMNKINFNQIDNKEKFILHIRLIDGPGGKSGNVSSKVSYYCAVNKLVGFPYLISFNKNDNLQTIIDQPGFDFWLKNNISCCYKFNGARANIMNVPRRAKSYKHIQTYNEIMLRDLNECLIVKLKKSLNVYRKPKKKPQKKTQIRKSMFNVDDTVIFEGEKAQVMAVIGLNAVEITYPVSKNISQRTRVTVFRRQLQTINVNNSNNNSNTNSNNNSNNNQDIIFFKLNAPSSNTDPYFKIKMRKHQTFGTIIGVLESKFNMKTSLYFKGVPISENTTPQNLIENFGAKNDDFINANYIN